ncbi:uncharacterized protein PV09_02987 [Verruconis gallopava]|uniref:Glutathione S-transferase n=1 Tax=Verruconis gallopava TaxID=253628 RepID=A0A0D1Z0R6_9PEZI|nr:uncharacterized protein PV09_02987 [Verruconis gallopava]KIW06557.1 hypothetical protein PV09_02987 [Verruconis gallopava]
MATAPSDKQPKPGLNVYVSPAVNPYKLPLLCEELGIPYNPIRIDAMQQEQKSEWYTRINPNGRLPALVHVKDDGETVQVWESAACMLYIVATFDRDYKVSYPPTSQEYWQMVSWLTWQVAGMGPMMGQAAHFVRYSLEDVPYGARRYVAESRRLFSVLEKQLTESEYLVGSKLTVADIAIFIWAMSASWCGVDISEFPAVKAWRDRIAQRPAIQRGLKVPMPYPFTDDKVTDPKRRGIYEMIQKHGKEMNRSELEELMKPRGRL